MKAQGNKNLGAIPDLERVPDLAPDLVWLLGNDRAEVEGLTRTLLNAYGNPLSYLARAYLDDHEMAERVVQAIMIQILAEGRHFGGKQDVDIWIFRLAFKNSDGCPPQTANPEPFPWSARALCRCRA